MQCQSDGVVFINPQPSGEALQSTYDSYGAELSVQTEYTTDDCGVPGYLEKFRPFRKLNQLLELGAASGNYLLKCRDDGWQVRGVELSRPSAEYARSTRGLAVFAGTIHEASLPSGAFDVVVAWATLEHVPNPREVMTEIYRILRPGGLFVFSVPHWNGISFTLLREKHRYVGRDHLFYFSSNTAAQLLSQLGYKDVRTSSRNFNPVVFLQDLRSGQTTQSQAVNPSTSAALELKRSELAPKQKLLRFVSPKVWQAAYRFVSGSVGILGRGDLLIAQGLKHEL